VVAVGDTQDGRRTAPAAAGDGARLLSTAERSQPARRLAAAALELFYRQGAMATTVRDITNACGLTPGALYNHFGSKNELLYVIVRDIHTRLLAAVESARAAGAGDPRSELTAIVRHYVNSHTNNRQSVRVANREYVMLTGEWLAEVVALRRRLRDQVADVLWAGQQRGAFTLVGEGRAGATMTAITILDMCVHISEWFEEGRPLTTAQLADRYVTLAMRVVGATPSEETGQRSG
jgi:AcrR family transcriptional regulator